mmetsp:Transcript_71007/g.197243  ORF Transcript_71007/g.197243 Transcript_71007/m.197243 type:complete len:370 (+) Transcript_71007:98-1207(+)
MLNLLNSRNPSWNIVERLLFPAPPPQYSILSFPGQLILVPDSDGRNVPCLFMRCPHARFVLIYFHANAEDLGFSYEFCRILCDELQVHILAVEYPGYGICPGRTDEAGIIANARAALRFVMNVLEWPADGIKIFGRSLGTGPALALAAEQPGLAGLILVSPFTSIRCLFRQRIGDMCELVEDRFPNLVCAREVFCPTLIVHGQKDGLVPVSHAKQIYDALTSKKMLVTPTDMGHNTSLLRSFGLFLQPMTRFFPLPDYTFEDIELPAWVSPRGEAETEPRAITTLKPAVVLKATRGYNFALNMDGRKESFSGSTCVTRRPSVGRERLPRQPPPNAGLPLPVEGDGSAKPSMVLPVAHRGDVTVIHDIRL